MEAYSLDLRERVVAACDEGIDTRVEIAERFGVSTSFIRKLLRRKKLTGLIAVKPRAGGRKPSMHENDLQKVRDRVERKPDATLGELCRELAIAGGNRSVRPWTMCRRLKLPRKKSLCTPASVTRHAFKSCVKTGWRRSARFRPGSWFLLTRAAQPARLTRTHGRAPPNQRVVGAVPQRDIGRF
ncbi:MAG TPA: helix-turn-helix domain-containing protein [Tepidisphaeraceae bacterium]|nr:helix-turn-helix domain-containing protein [Tepidisphaeraceae bacterium]